MTKLEKLGFKTYREYLASDHWKQFRSRYRAAGKSMRCTVCNDVPAQFHHVSYSRLGAELFSDVVLLCAFHHDQVHDELKFNGWDISKTHAVVAELRRLLGHPPIHPVVCRKPKRGYRRCHVCSANMKAKKFVIHMWRKHGVDLLAKAFAK